MYGSLQDIGIDLYAPGGRLHNIADESDVSWRALVRKWESEGVEVSPENAHVEGSLGFVSGQ